MSALRAWILPSFGWEDSDALVGKSGAQRTDLGQLMIEISPAGYFRWRSTRKEFCRVVSKLANIRRLQRARPSLVIERVPSLLELRQTFRLALATGDSQLATSVIDAVNRHELDTASNGAFMRIEANHAFGTPQAIVSDPELPNVVTLRAPHRIRAAIVEAFYLVFLHKFVEAKDWRGGLDEYESKVRPIVGDLQRTVDPASNLEVQRCLAFLVASQGDSSIRSRLLSITSDLAVSAICSLNAEAHNPDLNSIEKFERAWNEQDWTSAQALGESILKDASQSDETKQFVARVLRRSLEDRPSSRLNRVVSTELPEAEPLTIPQDWDDLVATLRQGDFDSVTRFLNLEDRPRVDFSSASEVDSLFSLVGDLLTMPGMEQVRGVDLRDTIATALIDDCLSDQAFPNAALSGVYELLFDFWAEQRKRSGSSESETVFSLLATGLLELDINASDRVLSATRAWWTQRRTSKRFDFVLRNCEMLHEMGALAGGIKEAWEGISQEASDLWASLGTTQRLAWLRVGHNVHASAECIKQLSQITVESQPDPLSAIQLDKIAIVSLNESAAMQAAAEIRSRTKCQVVLVTDKTAGASTQSAQNADVILFVWRATKHAVYRAFDKVRDRIEYVSGSGAASIVRALENRAMATGSLPSRT